MILGIADRRLVSWYSTKPPRNSYKSCKTPLQLWWYNKVPLTVKYFGVVGLTAYTLTHVGHEVMLTVGPPLIVGGYFAYKWYNKRMWKLETEKITNKDLDIIRIPIYDETNVDNVLQGLESQFDHFKRNIIDVVETKIIDYAVQQKTNEQPGEIETLFIEGDQINVNINENEVETFKVLKIVPPQLTKEEIFSNDLVDFIKLSLPFYSSKDIKSRKRLGVIQVYLLENKQEDTLFHEYKMEIEIIPFLLFTPKILSLNRIYHDKVLESKMLQDNETENMKTSN